MHVFLLGASSLLLKWFLEMSGQACVHWDLAGRVAFLYLHVMEMASGWPAVEEVLSPSYFSFRPQGLGISGGSPWLCDSEGGQRWLWFVGKEWQPRVSMQHRQLPFRQRHSALTANSLISSRSTEIWLVLFQSCLWLIIVLSRPILLKYQMHICKQSWQLFCFHNC